MAISAKTGPKTSARHLLDVSQSGVVNGVARVPLMAPEGCVLFSRTGSYGVRVNCKYIIEFVKVILCYLCVEGKMVI